MDADTLYRPTLAPGICAGWRASSESPQKAHADVCIIKHRETDLRNARSLTSGTRDRVFGFGQAASSRENSSVQIKGLARTSKNKGTHSLLVTLNIDFYSPRDNRGRATS